MLENAALQKRLELLYHESRQASGFVGPVGSGFELPSQLEPRPNLSGLRSGLPLDEARTLTLSTLVFFQWFAAFTFRSPSRPIWQLRPNRWMYLILVLAVLLHLDVSPGIREALEAAAKGQPVVVDVRIDYSKRTRFTQGVVSTVLKRFPLGDKFRFIGRASIRKVTG